MHPDVIVQKKGATLTLQDVAKAAIPPLVWRQCYGALYVKYAGSYTYVWYGGSKVLVFDPDGDKFMEVDLLGLAPTCDDVDQISDKVKRRLESQAFPPPSQEPPQQQP